MDGKNQVDENIELFMQANLFFPYHITFLFALAEVYLMEIVVDMYALKIGSEVPNGKLMVKLWDCDVLFIHINLAYIL